ncbi:MAG: TolB family protein [Pseudomonadota bacterium]
MLRFDVFSWSPESPPVCISPGDGAYFQSTIHPDGEHALFWGGPYGPPRIWRADLDGNDCVPLTPEDSGARHPSYCLNGQRIVYVSDGGVKQVPETVEAIFHDNPTGPLRRDLILHIFSMKPDGSDVRQITDGPVQDLRPSLSPDGKFVCFFSIRGGSTGLWLVPADGSEKPRKLKIPITIYRPVWSPDGARIYGFAAIRNDRHQVGWVNPHSGEWTPLANDDRAATHSPVPDPSGKSLLVHSNRSGRWALYELKLDGVTPPLPIVPQGFENLICSHPNRARNGVMTFDSLPEESWARFKPGNQSVNY